MAKHLRSHVRILGRIHWRTQCLQPLKGVKPQQHRNLDHGCGARLVKVPKIGRPLPHRRTMEHICGAKVVMIMPTIMILRMLMMMLMMMIND